MVQYQRWSQVHGAVPALIAGARTPWVSAPRARGGPRMRQPGCAGAVTGQVHTGCAEYQCRLSCPTPGVLPHPPEPSCPGAPHRLCWLAAPPQAPPHTPSPTTSSAGWLPHPRGPPYSCDPQPTARPQVPPPPGIMKICTHTHGQRLKTRSNYNYSTQRPQHSGSAAPPNCPAIQAASFRQVLGRTLTVQNTDMARKPEKKMNTPQCMLQAGVGGWPPMGGQVRLRAGMRDGA